MLKIAGDPSPFGGPVLMTVGIVICSSGVSPAQPVAQPPEPRISTMDIVPGFADAS